MAQLNETVSGSQNSASENLPTKSVKFHLTAENGCSERDVGDCTLSADQSKPQTYRDSQESDQQLSSRDTDGIGKRRFIVAKVGFSDKHYYLIRSIHVGYSYSLYR